MMFDFLSAYWSALFPAAVGFAGIYLLLPRLERRYRVLGAVAAGGGLLLAGLLLIDNVTDPPETILFYAFSGLAILGGGLMLAQHNPVHAALSFALVVLSTCGLFLLLAAPFLMAATIIVYAGAVVVTFLFVIMLAQQAGLTSADQRSREPFLACLAGFVLLFALLCVLQKTYSTTALDALITKVKTIARAKTEVDLVRILGRPVLGNRSLALVDEIEKQFPNFDRAKLDNANGYWNETPMNVAKMATLFEEIKKHAERHFQLGSLRPPADLPLSPFSGPPPNKEGPHQLPAHNVAGLGKTLFTDHLLAVELAGTLLLVASIGAIAIAARQREGLR
jgi:NADH:ubiquinone oxidoreductase subunit 6 (subunit J)